MNSQETKKSRWSLIKRAMSGMLILLLIYVCIMIFSPFPLIPEIGKNLPPNFVNAEEVFSERVKATFPPQTKEVDIISKLEDQGFSVNPATKEADFKKPVFPCELEWSIYWSSENGLITKIDANFGRTCF